MIILYIYTGCSKCEAQDHWANDCRDKIQVRSGLKKSYERSEEKELYKQTKRSKVDWNRYLKRHERDISSKDDEEVKMLSTYTTESNIEEACLSEEEE